MEAIFSRLYYLTQNSERTLLEEKKVMKFLFWATPATTALMVSLEIGENFTLHLDNPVLFFFSYCAKTPYPLHIQDSLIVCKLWLTLFVPILFAVLILNFIIMIKHTKIESQASVHVISGYLKLDHGHERFVVSVMGHFFSHVATFTENILILLVMLYMPDNYMAAKFRDISVFLTPCLNFLLYPSIETLFTGKLKASLIGAHFVDNIISQY